MRAQDFSLRAGRVIFVERGDLLEQFRSGLVIEPARGHGLLLLAQTGENIGAKGAVDSILVAIDDCYALLGPHHTSLARRNPVNCQRWCG